MEHSLLPLDTQGTAIQTHGFEPYGTPSTLLHNDQDPSEVIASVGTSLDQCHDSLGTQGEWSSRPTQDDWERLKPTIIDLYKDHSLEEVRAIMKAKHNFNVTYAFNFSL